MFSHQQRILQTVFRQLRQSACQPSGITGLELGSHREARKKSLNRTLHKSFGRHLFEIKSELGQRVKAEMWDRGWAKNCEVLPAAEPTEEYQETVGGRLAETIVCMRPIYVPIRNEPDRSSENQFQFQPVTFLAVARLCN
ncbi:MAG: hypothetical protein PVJ75_13650 [Chloroflexota bacterium]|jgi:hypothetical protein